MLRYRVRPAPRYGDQAVGLFACRSFPRGAIVVPASALNKDRFLSWTDVRRLDAIDQQAIADFALGSPDGVLAPEDFASVPISRHMNHSCDPNIIFDADENGIADRDIGAGEELVWDYGRGESNPAFRMTCACGSAACRGVIKGSDWQGDTRQGLHPSLRDPESRRRMFWRHPALAPGPSAVEGQGLIATEALEAGETLILQGGYILTLEEEAALPEALRDKGVQIERTLILGPACPEQVGGITEVNHSCQPNCGIRDGNRLVAIPPIAAGEEISFDYATVLWSDGPVPTYLLECRCNQLGCRGVITDLDWRRPEVVAARAGWFSPFLQRILDAASA